MLNIIEKRIILVEDDEKLANQIVRFLTKQHYSVKHVADGNAAISLIKKDCPQLVILDLMLPNINGLDICRMLKPGFLGDILMLTGSDDDIDQVTALEIGADGYLTKPIQPRVLLAHIRLLERKREHNATHITGSIQRTNNNLLEINKLHIHRLQRTVILNGDNIKLKPSEFEVLKVLAEKADSIVSRDEILKSYRGIEYDGFDRSIDVKVASLRKKLGDSKQTGIITVRAKGYMLVADAWK